MTYVIVEPCIGDKNASCVDVCPVSCIYEPRTFTTSTRTSASSAARASLSAR
jgi:NAD-dependent dihydropyrimidine dehydrogenase PreA subunit